MSQLCMQSNLTVPKAFKRLMPYTFHNQMFKSLSRLIKAEKLLCGAYFSPPSLTRTCVSHWVALRPCRRELRFPVIIHWLFLSQRNRRPDLSTNIQTFRATFQCLVTIQLNVSLEVQVSMSDHDSIEQFSLFQNIGSIIQIFYYDCFVVFFLFKYQNTVNRRLARYSPRATTTNQPTVH